jgi:anti-sigma-K factor RskA
VNDDLHTLAGAYALDALPEDDRARFEGHLARCEACLQEVRGLREASAQLGVAVAARAPARLRTQTLARIAEVRQLPPAVPEVADLAAERARRPRRRPLLAYGLAAACLIVALFSSFLAVRWQQDLSHERATAQAVAAVLSAPDARTASAPVQGGSATVVVSQSRDSMVFASSGLRQLPKSRTYELWLMSPAGARPAGLLRPDFAGRTDPLVNGTLGDAKQVGLTVEPAGGSPQPTSTPFLVLDLPA